MTSPNLLTGFDPQRYSLAYERFKDLVRYDPEDGAFYWTDTKGRREGVDRRYRLGHPRKNKKGEPHFVIIRLNRATLLAHYLAPFWMGRPIKPDEKVVHINGNSHDNRWTNLKIRERYENEVVSNKRPPRPTKPKFVSAWDAARRPARLDYRKFYDRFKDEMFYDPETGKFIPLSEDAPKLETRTYRCFFPYQGREYLAARAAAEWVEKDFPRHAVCRFKDNNPTNLKWSNLEFSRNNVKTSNKHGYRGVFKNRGKYFASLTYRGSIITTRPRPTPEEAARDYDTIAREYHGKLAVLNIEITNGKRHTT